MLFNGLLVLSGLLWLSYFLMRRHSAQTPQWVQFSATVFLILLFIKSATLFGIEIVLFILMLGTGLTWLGYVLLRRYKKLLAEPHWVEQSRSLFPIIVIIFVLRSFWVEPYRIPTGSLIPTLLIGDVIIVNKYVYGIRLPILHQKIISVSDLKVGDIAVFLWPVDPSMYFIKRVVGVPGDKIKYIDKVIYRNGKPVPQMILGPRLLEETADSSIPVIEKREVLDGVKHDIYIRPDELAHDMAEITVPPGNYFMMGDNRDGSFDSRGWGFVPEKNIIGKASYVAISWDSLAKDWMHKIRWNRIWKKIH